MFRSTLIRMWTREVVEHSMYNKVFLYHYVSDCKSVQNLRCRYLKEMNIDLLTSSFPSSWSSIQYGMNIREFESSCPSFVNVNSLKKNCNVLIMTTFKYIVMISRTSWNGQLKCSVMRPTPCIHMNEFHLSTSHCHRQCVKYTNFSWTNFRWKMSWSFGDWTIGILLMPLPLYVNGP